LTIDGSQPTIVATKGVVMPMERWGTLSVRDHLDLQAVIADLLLYDRLVFPVLSGEVSEPVGDRKIGIPRRKNA
jgi:hypothetical protein